MYGERPDVRESVHERERQEEKMGTSSSVLHIASSHSDALMRLRGIITKKVSSLNYINCN